MIFAKAPLPGEVKTRLGKSVGMRRAAMIYQKMLYQFLKKIDQCHFCSIELWCYPDTRHPFFRRCKKDFGLVLKRQQGRDLGHRMKNAFQSANRFHDFSILMGSDIPEINIEDFKQVRQYMSTNVGLVMMPTFDGGYGLIAMKKANSGLFTNMTWSTKSVLKDTLLRAKRRGLTYKLLVERADIDNKADYIAYCRR